MGRPSFPDCLLPVRLWSRNASRRALIIIFVILVSCFLIGSLTSRILSFTEAREPLVFFVGGFALTEGAMLLGVLLIPYYQDTVIAMSCACMVTCLPFS